jgi:hypothetical protein
MSTATRNKTRTALWSAVTLAVGTPQTSAWIDLSSADGASLSVRFTNGATGPTAAAALTVTVANAYNAGAPVLPITYTQVSGGTGNNEVDAFAIEIPSPWAAVQISASGNTGQSITLDADISVNTSWTIA